MDSQPPRRALRYVPSATTLTGTGRTTYRDNPHERLSPFWEARVPDAEKEGQEKRFDNDDEGPRFVRELACETASQTGQGKGELRQRTGKERNLVVHQRYGEIMTCKRKETRARLQEIQVRTSW